MQSSYISKIKCITFILFCLAGISSGLDIVTTYDTPGYAYKVTDSWTSFNHVCADSIGVVDIRNDGTMWTNNTPGCAYDVRVIGHEGTPVFVVADGDSGLHAFYSDSVTGRLHDFTYAIPGKATCVEEYYNQLIFVGSDKGLFVFDFSNPASATLIFSDTTWSKGVEDIVAEYGRAAVLSQYGSHLVNLRITGTDSVYIESVFRMYGDTCGVEILVDTIYMVTHNTLYIVAPTIGNDEVYQEINGVKYVWLKKPISVTEFEGHGVDIVTVGRYAYISVKKNWKSNFNGVLVYDISDRTNPVLVDSCSTPGTAGGIYMSDDSSGVHGMRGKSQIPERYVYLASGEPGVVALDDMVAISDDGNHFSSMHLSDWTNQVRLIPTSSNLFIILPEVTNAPVSITIVAPNGRTVRSIFRGVNQKGRYSHFWDFKDNYGNPVPSGIYYINLRMNGYSFIKSFIKL